MASRWALECNGLFSTVGPNEFIIWLWAYEHGNRCCTMTRTYRISVDHHKTYGIKGRAKYGLMIVLAGATSGIPKELFSDEELRDGSS
jgi:hypothetical protein